MKRIDPKRLAVALIITLGLFEGCRPSASVETEMYVRTKVVQLEGNGYACTGVQVRSPKGHDYILSAGHCYTLSKDGSVWAKLDNGRAIPRRVLEESMTSDLLLIEGMPDLQGIPVAEVLHPVDRVVTLTHGQRLPTFRTEGEVLGDFDEIIPFAAITSDEDQKACESKPKQKVTMSFFGPVCSLVMRQTLTTARVLPGSSGGPAINLKGELVGIVSIGGEFLSGFVMLSDIKTFLAPY